MKREAVARVDEARCIGCTRCIDACPVDAIVGAQGLMHAVVEAWCIGCRLCPPACPVDCIDMAAPKGKWTQALKQAAGDRARRRRKRAAREAIPASTAEQRRRILAGLLGKGR